MSESEDKTKNQAQGTGTQYLFALLRCAEWVDKPYRKIAIEHKDETEFLKELYMCACDGVSVEQIQEVAEDDDAINELQEIRFAHLHEVLSEEEPHETELSNVLHRTESLESSMQQMLIMVKLLASQVPSFDAMFPEEPAPKKRGRKAVKHNDQAITDFSLPEHYVKPEEPGKKPEQKKHPLLLWLGKRQTMTSYVEKLIEQGYSNEQLDFILGCIEEGVDREMIESFASPKLPVEVMKRLKILAERKKEENKNG